MVNFDLFSLFAESFALLRARWLRYVAVHTALALPMMLGGVLVVAANWDMYMAIFRGASGGGFPMVQPTGASQFAGLLLYPVMIVCYPIQTCLTTRLALDQLQGIDRPVLEVLPTLVRPILWVMLMDTILLLVIYIGCVCCLLPGLALFLLFATWLSLQTAALCDQPIDWIEAGRRSKQLTEPYAGTTIGGAFLFIGMFFAFGLVMWLFGVVVFAAVNGGFAVDSGRFVLAIGIAYGITIVASWVPQSLLMSHWYVWRAVGYHRLTRGAGAPALAQVFS